MFPAALKKVDFDDLPDWRSADLQLSFEAFQRSANEILARGRGFDRQPVFGGTHQDWLEPCQKALLQPRVGSFFEEHFIPLQVRDGEKPNGLFTGYFEPEAEASRVETPDYQVPIYARPLDLVAFDTDQSAACGLAYGRLVHGRPEPYFSREQIEKGALRGRGLEFAWLKHWEDAFFIHIQGQGRLHMTDGTTMRLAYAGKSGRAYTGIGSELVKRGELSPLTNSMQSIRAWMADHPHLKRALMWANTSFVFFREEAVTDPDLGAVGAQLVNLTPRRSLAVDRAVWMFGTPLWLATKHPPEAGGNPFNHLMIAQDTGTAIKGAARGDIYWGWGDEAAWNAGHMKSPGTLVALLPKTLALRLLEAA
jgi:membrane-bound lytic murein transglycosylase A